MNNKGQIPWNKDLKGTHFSPRTEFKKGIIPWNKGKKGVPSPRKDKPLPKLKGNTNGFKKGQIPWNKGLKSIHLSRKTEFKKGNVPPFKGKCLPEHVKLIKEAGYRKYVEKHGGPWKDKANDSRFRDILFKAWHSSKKTDTSIELKVKEYLSELGIKYVHPYYLKPNLVAGRQMFILDFYVPSSNLIIECDGDYWHSLPKVIERDKVKINYLTERGFRVLSLSESLINQRIDCLSKLRGALAQIGSTIAGADLTIEVVGMQAVAFS
jgi:G:T-mismatch repair DNA endonuclease (very short patch repair protein)